MSTQQDIFNLIRSFSGQLNVITLPREYVRMFEGDIPAALMMGQLIYWADRASDSRGWFYKSYADWEEELCLSEYQVRRAAKKLIQEGFLETKLAKVNGAPTVHYKVNMVTFSESILNKLKNGNLRNSGMESLESCVSSNTQNLHTKPTSKYKRAIKDGVNLSESVSLTDTFLDLTKFPDRDGVQSVIQKLLVKHSADEIREKMQIVAERANISNPIAALYAALRDNWQRVEKKNAKKPDEPGNRFGESYESFYALYPELKN